MADYLDGDTPDCRVHWGRTTGRRTVSCTYTALSEVGSFPSSHGRKWRKTELTGLRGQTAKRRGRERSQLRSPTNRHLTPLFSTLNTDRMMIGNYKKKNWPRAPSANKNTNKKKSPPPPLPPPHTVLSGPLGLGVDAAEISSWRNPPFWRLIEGRRRRV